MSVKDTCFNNKRQADYNGNNPTIVYTLPSYCLNVSNYNISFQVKKNSFQHTCSSTRRKKKVVNATKHWICEKVKDWLIDDATLGAKALQKKLKEHHKVHIHYMRVYKGMELALN